MNKRRKFVSKRQVRRIIACETNIDLAGSSDSIVKHTVSSCSTYSDNLQLHKILTMKEYLIHIAITK